MILLILELFFGLFSLFFDVTMSYSIHDMRTELELSPPTLLSRSTNSRYAWAYYYWYNIRLSLLRLGEALEQYSDSILQQNTQELLQLVRHFHELPSFQTPNASTANSQIASLYVLSQTLWASFQQEHNQKDLFKCIDCLREALCLCARDEIPDAAEPLNFAELGVTTLIFYSGYAETGRMELLDMAVQHLREELSFPLNNNLFHAQFMFSLASTYLLYNRQKDTETAIGLFDAVLGLQLAAHESEKVKEAIECGRKALAMCNSGGGVVDALRFRVLLQLCRALMHPSRSTQALTDSGAEAQKLLKTAQRYISFKDDSRWALIWKELAQTLILLHDIDQAVHLLQKSSAHAPASIRVRLDAAHIWISAAQGSQHPSLLHAYETYINLLDLYLISMPSLDEQRDTLGSIPQLPTLGMDAAAVAINTGEYQKAVELFEQGRGILWARMRGYRYSIFGMQGQHSELAQKFLDINRELEALAVSAQVHQRAHLPDVDLFLLSRDPFQPIPVNDESIHRDIFRHRRLLRDREDVIGEIRELDGFKHFLMPMPYDELKKAAAGGPVIIVNISCIRCDALIIYHALTSDSTCLQVIPLSPQLFTQIPSIAVGIWSAVRSQRGSLALDVTNLDNSERLGIKVKSNVKTKQAMFEDALKHLWDLVAIPVKGKLDLMQGMSETRVWWCPTSYLSSLPIHAAGIAAQDIHFCDHYISSYTASLSALISARRSSHFQPHMNTGPVPSLEQPITAATTILLVGQPDRSIPAVCTEIAQIQALTSNQLWDGQKLTLVDLMNINLPNAEFAFLAACHTASAMGGNNTIMLHTPDKSLHLASAMQFIGFHAVVGTLWAMVDADGPVIAEAFYKHIFRDRGGGKFKDSAAALDVAVRINTTTQQRTNELIKSRSVDIHVATAFMSYDRFLSKQVFNRKAGQNWGQVCPHVRSQAVMVDVSRILFNWD
ncbi:hypothetical protein BT96DRAFT_939909 [Gymnopus androsaceus JB14]|uniref:CHAT domain-containing protein n=1 Tax=Gymnopus androsaceus JB14 TaxID=1447944 RepID=A0A6A4HMW0_9AGAR|nr:hypothetical protein BT96DRAFT_939909 [Gymnopus androsaceus JB14]